MDDRRFDALAKSASQAPSRRQLLRLLGGGGLLAGLGGAVGRAAEPASAAAPCLLDFTGAVRIGPSAGELLAGDHVTGELRGQVRFTLDKNGALKGQLTLPDGSSAAATGKASGEALTLRLALPNQQVAVAVGAGSHDLASCQGTADGVLTGPRPGDLGDWHGRFSKAAPDATATATAAAASNGNGGDGVPGNAVPAATAPPTATEISTAAPTATETATPAPTATTTGVRCFLPLVPCGGVCVDPTSDVANCGGCGAVCPAGQAGQTATCAAGVCALAATCSSGLALCRGVCVDLQSDSGNCGSCDQLCGFDGFGTGLVCGGGQCVCPPGLTLCPGGCSDPLTSDLHCGGCGHACAADQSCVNGACAGGTHCPAGQINCGGTCVRAKICP